MENLSVRYCKTQNDSVPADALDFTIGTLLILLVLVNLGCTGYYFFRPAEDGRGKIKYFPYFSFNENIIFSIPINSDIFNFTL